MDLVELKEMNDIIDDNIGKHHKILDLERNSGIIKATLESGEKRMDKLELDIINIKDSQADMSIGIASIKQSVEADDGIRDMIKDNIRTTKENSAQIKDLGIAVSLLHASCQANKDLTEKSTKDIEMFKQKISKRIEPVERIAYGISALAIFSGFISLVLKITGVI